MPPGALPPGVRRVTFETVLRAWVRRETRPVGSPDADPADWSVGTLQAELERTFGEPAGVARNSAAWVAVDLDGEALGDLGVFPEPAWQRFSGDGTVRGAVDRFIREPDAAETEFPDATRTIRGFRERLPGPDLGAAVAQQWPDDPPPRLLDGNHRACAVHWAAREGADVSLTVHLGHETGSLHAALARLGLR